LSLVRLQGEPQRFHEEPETPISILISTTVLHLDIFLRYALSTAGTHSLCSGVFNLLKFEHTPHEKKTKKRNEKLWFSHSVAPGHATA